MPKSVITETLKGIDSINLLIIFPVRVARFLSTAGGCVANVSKAYPWADSVLGCGYQKGSGQLLEILQEVKQKKP